MTKKHSIDPALIRKIAEGNREAEKQLFRDFDLLLKLGFIVRARVQVSREEQQDLIADIAGTILQLLRDGKYDPSRGSLGVYVKGVARNKIREYFRSSKRAIARSDVEPDELPDLEKEHDHEELREQFASIIRQMSAKYREVLVARYYHELSISEIAQNANLTDKQVYNRLHYAIRLLKEKLYD